MTRRRVFAAVALGSFATVAVACSLLVPLNDVQCSNDNDCHARGEAFLTGACVENVCVRSDAGTVFEAGVADSSDAGPEAAIDASGPWGCLQLPPESSDPMATDDLTIVVFDAFQAYTLGGSVDGGSDLDIVSGTLVQGVDVQQCQPLDPTCNGAATYVTNDAGAITIATKGDFDGYYYLQQAGSFPMLMYPGRLLTSEPQPSFPTTLLPFSIAEGLAAELDVDVSENPDAGVGHIFTLAFDCQDRHAAGVSYSIDVKAGSLFYQQNSLPSLSATMTDTAGSGGFLDVPTGVVKVTATIVDIDGTDAGHSVTLPAYSVFVRAAQQTLVYFRPKSRPAQ